MKDSTPLEEQEVTINLYSPRLGDKADVFSSIPNMNKKLRDLAKKRPDIVSITKDTGNEVFALVDRSCVKIAPKRSVSEAQRLAMSQRLTEARKKKGETL